MAGTAITSHVKKLKGRPNFLCDISFSEFLSSVTNNTSERILLGFLTEVMTGDVDGDESHNLSFSDSFTVARKKFRNIGHNI